MKVFGKTVYASDGWPLETIKGRPVLNFFRVLFLGDIIRTIRHV